MPVHYFNLGMREKEKKSRFFLDQASTLNTHSDDISIVNTRKQEDQAIFAF
jgi:hypothetical protein